MSGDQSRENTPTLEMRLAAIEDKLARLTVTEEEMATYNKVAGLAAARGVASSTPALSPRVCTISPVSNCWIHIQNCWIFQPIQPIVVNDCIQFAAGPAGSGAGFSRLGGD
jgi:hypothetical protein